MSEQVSGAGSLASRHWPAVLLVVIGIATYVNGLHNPFHFDDHAWLYKNHAIRELWPLHELIYAPPDNPLEARPVISLSIALNYALGREDPFGYHVVNVAIHLLAALTLLGIVRQTLLRAPLRERFERQANGLAFACGLLWMVHPVQTECVNYITQRTGSIMGLFYFLTLYCAIRAHNHHRAAWTFAAIVACALGMASKEVMVTAPFMVLLYDLVFCDESLRRMLRNRWPLYAGLAATWGLLAALMIAFPHEGTVGLGGGITPWDYLKCQSLVIVGYLRTIAWPDVLLLDYGYPTQVSFSEALPSGLLVVLLLLLTLWALTKGSPWGYLGAWFFVTLSPTSSFVPIITEVAAERRLYLPLAGVVVLCVFSAHWFLEKVGRTGAPTWKRRAALLSLLLISAVLISRTVARNHQYASAVSLWQDCAARFPDNPRALVNLGLALRKEGRNEEARQQLEVAIRVDPAFSSAHFNLANTLDDLGSTDQAIWHWQQAIALKPDYAEAHLNLGNALSRRGQYAQAAAHYQAALQVVPDYFEAHVSLGKLFLRQGLLKDSVSHLERACQIAPDHAEPRYDLGNVLLRQGKSAAAATCYRLAIELDPRLLPAYVNLGNVLRQRGEIDAAIEQYEAALQVAPQFAQAHYNLAAALRSKPSSVDRAIHHYQAALRADPSLVRAHIALGELHLARGEREFAVQHFREAARKDPNDAQAQRNLRRLLAPEP